MSVTSQGTTMREPISAASGSPLLQCIALVGEGEFGTLAAQDLAIPRQSIGCWQHP